MTNYTEITIKNITTRQSEILIALLSDIGFHGFEENDNMLIGFINTNSFNEEELKRMLSTYHLSYSKNILEHRNWNNEWEKNFEPVIIDDFVAIRADFHAPVQNVEHEIIITPKMSFGTGHHATTWLMMQQMRKIDFKNKSVFDFGTGTGILSILSEKLGAKNIMAIDNDEWSINNTLENIERNNCTNIQVALKDTPPSAEKYDIILANINKNVILCYFSYLEKVLNSKGHLLVSGLLPEDEADILNVSKKLSVNHIETFQRQNWICMEFRN